MRTPENISHRPPWMAGSPAAPGPLPDGDVDVLVVGGGITGLTAAVTAAELGARVALLEARHLAAGTTGVTTGKVTSQHGLRYQQLVASHGHETAMSYAGANQEAIGIVDGLVERYGIDCRLESVSHVVHAATAEGVRAVEEEHRVVRSLGLPATLDTEVEAPLAARAALRFDDQRHIEPVRYVLGLAEALVGLGGSVHTGTRVVGVRPGARGVRVRTDRGELRARHVVVATLLPPLDRTLAFTRQKPVRAYGIALQVAGGLPSGSYLGVDEPTRSVRTAQDENGRRRLVVVGESHLVGREPHPGARIERLRAFAARRWNVEAVTHQWSGQDYQPIDGLPTIGPMDRQGTCWVACGFGKWGLTGGTHAGWAIAHRLSGLPASHRKHWRRPRRIGRRELGGVARFNLDSGRRLLTDHVRALVGERSLAPGEGAVVRRGARLVAVHRRDDGSLGEVSAHCTHLGCVVAWNAFERSWDCPCHGSRFDADGQVLEGPATKPLPPLARDEPPPCDPRSGPSA
jgi:glycine/D-amino acid oxidase-like deaminating enzyme/nitrite reductase/ring-hydroxylating ferredoxin subunit